MVSQGNIGESSDRSSSLAVDKKKDKKKKDKEKRRHSSSDTDKKKKKKDKEKEKDKEKDRHKSKHKSKDKKKKSKNQRRIFYIVTRNKFGFSLWKIKRSSICFRKRNHKKNKGKRIKISNKSTILVLKFNYCIKVKRTCK